MLPKSTLDKVECLESLVGVRTGCTVTENYPFWIEDIEGVDVDKLAKLAKGSNGTGKDFGQQLINSSARELLGDIELLMNNGYSMKNIAGDMCSSCTLLPTYVTGGGITITSNINSRFRNLQITKLTMLTNVTGPRVFILDDGITQTEKTVQLTAGMNVPVKLNYITSEPKVKVYFQDSSVGVGRVSCATNSDCGCGSSSKATLPLIFSGLLNGSEVTGQYGFLACAAVTCSYDALVCNMIKLTPNVFGQTLLYKIGEKYYLHKSASERNNEAASYNEEEKSVFVRNYGALYATRLYGKGDRRAVKNIINDYLKQNKDTCVTCHAKIMTAGATG